MDSESPLSGQEAHECTRRDWTSNLAEPTESTGKESHSVASSSNSNSTRSHASPVQSSKAPHRQLIINDVPNEECRVAVVENGRLEEYFTERESQELHVGNIYLGRVANVESGIQAAFVDFGVGRNGFLHITDLHPMYFPGSDQETTEAVGQKTPHRERPPIQACLKRGQEIIVQVLKEGIGNKGPTLTSYISLPGRFLVMMPFMERLGVSRKVEDLDTRREAMKILDSLDLPEGFGFILRTAGLERTKTELKKDLAYLLRLWKNIQKKRETSKAPTELFVESDLLIRAVRDILASNPDEIIVDNAEGLRRIEDYLSVIAPRTRGTKISGYNRPWPIFHYYGIEEQIRSMHSRSVPLPSGGMLVFDSAEAAVIIDVNSAKARHYHDAETTAHKVNQEAVDEVCRQLRLRDLGGLVIVDFIDMRLTSHKRDIENRLRTRLKRDRAKADFLRISDYGIVEMTRQRMRPSLLKAHTIDCPACEGHGKIQAPEPVAFDAIRTASHYICVPQIARLEMVVSPPVAGVMLNKKRRQISDLERRTAKTIEVRVSQTIPLDRVDFYAYDVQGADIALAELRIDLDAVSLPDIARDEAAFGGEVASATIDESVEPHLREAERTIAASAEFSGSAAGGEPDQEQPGGGRKRRRRRRRRGGRGTEEGAPMGSEVQSAGLEGRAGVISPTPEAGIVVSASETPAGIHVVSPEAAINAGSAVTAQDIPSAPQRHQTSQQQRYQVGGGGHGQHPRGPQGRGDDRRQDQRRFGHGQDQRRWHDGRGQQQPPRGGSQPQRPAVGPRPQQPQTTHQPQGRPAQPPRPPVASDRFKEVPLDRFRAILGTGEETTSEGSSGSATKPDHPVIEALQTGPVGASEREQAIVAEPQGEQTQSPGDRGGGGRGRRGGRGRGRGRGRRVGGEKGSELGVQQVREGTDDRSQHSVSRPAPVVTIVPQTPAAAVPAAAASPAAASTKPKRSLYSAFRRRKPGSARPSGGDDE